MGNKKKKSKDISKEVKFKKVGNNVWMGNGFGNSGADWEAYHKGEKIGEFKGGGISGTVGDKRMGHSQRVWRQLILEHAEKRNRGEA